MTNKQYYTGIMHKMPISYLENSFFTSKNNGSTGRRLPNDPKKMKYINLKIANFFLSFSKPKCCLLGPFISFDLWNPPSTYKNIIIDKVVYLLCKKIVIILTCGIETAGGKSNRRNILPRAIIFPFIFIF